MPAAAPVRRPMVAVSRRSGQMEAKSAGGGVGGGWPVGGDDTGRGGGGGWEGKERRAGCGCPALIACVPVPVTPSEQSLVVVDSVSDEALSKMLPGKLDFGQTSTYIMYGIGAFFGGWMLSAIVSAIDSIPLLPKLLEIVGLGYTIWFGTRYLLFKENRDELFVKVDDIKRRIIGTSEE